MEYVVVGRSSRFKECCQTSLSGKDKQHDEARWLDYTGTDQSRKQSALCVDAIGGIDPWSSVLALCA